MDLFTKKPDVYRAIPYTKGMEDGWYVLDDDGVTYYKNEDDAYTVSWRLRSRRPVVSPYIKDHKGCCIPVNESSFKLVNLTINEIFVVTKEQLDQMYSHYEGEVIVQS